MDEKKTDENFCPICVSTVPLAFSSGNHENENGSMEQEIEQELKKLGRTKKQKTNQFYMKCVSIFLVLIGIISLIVFLSTANNVK